MTIKVLRTIYQLKVSLLGVSPAVWRRLLVASSATLDELHQTIQIAMGWSNAHLHVFIQDNVCYGEISKSSPVTFVDESKYRLEHLLREEKQSLHYVYDLGDEWEHKITLEKKLSYDINMMLPSCVEASRACPPEDVGGAIGYEAFLEAITDSSHPHHRDMLAWFGGKFDADRIDLGLTNDMLKEYCR
jgi:hypothetical protein